MSRMRSSNRPSNTNTTIRGSRMTGTGFGMGRDLRNHQISSRSPQMGNKFATPQKIKGSGTFYSAKKKQTQFDATQYMVAECSLRDIEIYKQVFDFLDEDHDGNLTPLDLRKCIRQYGGYNPGRKFVYVAMSVFDSDDGGQIDFREFVKLMTLRPYQKDTQDDLWRVFQSVDEDSKGFIDQTDILKLAQQMKQEVSIQQIREAISHASPQGNGKINLKDFIKFCKRKNFD